MAGVELYVAADDRTGALEVAGRLAAAGNGPVTVTAWPRMLDDTDDTDGTDGPDDVDDTDTPATGHGPVAVVDLGSRHLSPGEARRRAAALEPGDRRGHKIDSTLRGNWADELAARAERHPVLLVPALPEFGRVCVGGEVTEHGRPVHEGAAGSDVRRRVTSSRPADLLASAGVRDVVEIGHPDALARWLAAAAGVAVADARSDDDIERIVDAWRTSGATVVLAGPSAVVGRARRGDVPARPLPRREGPVLVVCGSVHPSARAQLDHAARRGVPVATVADEITARQLAHSGAVVLATEIPVGDVDEPMAIAAAAGLARGVADLCSVGEIAALVVLGGDTAAAVIGDRTATVHGLVGPGTAWATLGDDPLPLVTRSGGFGDEAALVDLLRELRA